MLLRLRLRLTVDACAPARLLRRRLRPIVVSILRFTCEGATQSVRNPAEHTRTRAACARTDLTQSKKRCAWLRRLAAVAVRGITASTRLARLTRPSALGNDQA